MKALFLPLVAFVVFFALGGGAGAYVMQPAGPDSTMVDSTMVDSTHGDSSHTALGESADSTHDSTAKSVPHAVDTAVGGSTAPSDAHSAAPSPAPSSGAAVAAPGTASTGSLTIQSLLRAQTGTTVSMRADGTIGAGLPDSLPDYARMARLLSRMGPREAARTIERLGGTEAARALGAMSDKQAALVLSQLTPEKAAALLLATLSLLPKTAAP